MKKIYYAPYKMEAYGEEEIKAVEKCLKDGWLGGNGPLTEKFEKEVALLFGKKFGVFVNSGSSANMLALASLYLNKGSKVLTPACTFSTTVAPIIQLGLVPVFCDVMLTSYVPSVKKIYDYISKDVNKEIKVIMLPNLIGFKPDWKQIRFALNLLNREDIILIEDSCDTITKTEETDISTTSFYSSHVITAGGGGGMVMFNDEKLMKKALMYRDWGRIGENSENMGERFNHYVNGIQYDYKFLYEVLGYNFKSTEMNAAFGLVQLQKLDSFLEKREQNIKRYVDNLIGINSLILPDVNSKPRLLAMPLLLNGKSADCIRLGLLKHLEENSIQTRVTFAGNITRHPAFKSYEHNPDKFIVSDEIMGNGFLLGCHHGMNLEDVDYVCGKIKEYLT